MPLRNNLLRNNKPTAQRHAWHDKKQRNHKYEMRKNPNAPPQRPSCGTTDGNKEAPAKGALPSMDASHHRGAHRLRCARWLCTACSAQQCHTSFRPRNKSPTALRKMHRTFVGADTGLPRPALRCNLVCLPVQATSLRLKFLAAADWSQEGLLASLLPELTLP